MTRGRRPGRRHITGWGVVTVLLCAAFPALHGVYWAVPLTGAAASAAIAGWRLVALIEASHDHG